MLFEGGAQRLEERRDRAMARMTETEAKGEMVAMAQVDLAGERYIAVTGGGELVLHPESFGKILPAVGGADITA